MVDGLVHVSQSTIRIVRLKFFRAHPSLPSLVERHGRWLRDLYGRCEQTLRSTADNGEAMVSASGRRRQPKGSLK